MSDGVHLKAIEQQSAGQEESVLVADVGSSDSKNFFPDQSGLSRFAALALIVSFIVSSA